MLSMKITNKAKGPFEKLPIVIDYGICIGGILLFLADFFNPFFPKYIPFFSTNHITNGLLSIIIAILGYESSFKPKNYTSSNDTEIEYYSALFDKLKNSNIRYECAQHKGADNTRRLLALSEITEAEQQEKIKSRMTYFIYEFGQRPFNLIIIDHKYAFLGFYTHRGDLHMETVIKISGISETGRLLINRLTLWYDSFIKPDIKSENGIEVIDGSQYFKKPI